MATVIGTINNDFIHVAGDGLTPPNVTYGDIPLATNGDDVIQPLAGSDIIHAGAGDDRINFLANWDSTDVVNGGDGFDSLALNGDYSLGVFFGANNLFGIERIVVAAGNRYDLTFDDANVAYGEVMTIDGSSLGAADTLYIEAGDDTDGNFVARGGAGQDFLHGSRGFSDELYGFNGNDFLESFAAYARLDGGNGNDEIHVSGVGSSSHVRGGAGNDTIDAIGTILLLDAGADDDRVEVGSGSVIAGIFSGGSGFDRLFLTGTITVTGDLILPGSFEELVLNGNQMMLGTEVANVIDLTAAMGDSNSANIHGFGGNDKLTGTTLFDRLWGDDGNDTLSGGNGGNDTLNGGTGNDTYLISAPGDTIIEQTGAPGGTDTVQSSISFSLLNVANVERVILTGAGNTNATGNTLANVLSGNAGNNSLGGREGNDSLNGGQGADTMTGAEGRDQVAPGNDTAADVVRITQVSHSTGPARDLVIGMDLNGEDRFQLGVTPVAVQAATITTGTLSQATFNANLETAINAAALPANRAVLFDPDDGDLDDAGMVYLIVDANGIAGYQANADYVIQLQNMTGSLSLSDFL